MSQDSTDIIGKDLDEALDLIERLIRGNCYSRGYHLWSSTACPSFARAMRFLAKHGRFSIKESNHILVRGWFKKENDDGETKGGNI